MSGESHSQEGAEAVPQTLSSEQPTGHATRAPQVIIDTPLAIDTHDLARRYLDLSTSLFLALDSSGAVTLVNERVSRLVGIPQEDLVGLPWFERFVSEGQRDMLRGLFDHVMETGEGNWRYFEYDVLVPDGEPRLIAWRNSVLKEGGRTIGALCVGEDITEHRRMERALHESEQRIRCLISNNPDAIIISDGSRVQYTNAAGLRLLGAASTEEIAEHDVTEFLHPDDRQRIVDALREIMKGGHTWHGEFRVIPVDGMVRDVEAFVTATPHYGGRLLQTVARDITEHRLVERELRRREEEHRGAVLRSPLPMMVHADDGEILVLSEAWMRATGYTRAELPTMEDWIHRAFGKHEAQVRGGVDRLYASDGPPVSGESQITTATGEKRLWEFYSSPMGEDRRGRRIVVTIAVDVTERHRLQQEIVDVSEKERNRIGNDLHDGLASHLSGIAMLTRALANDIREGRPVDSRELDEIAELARAGTEQARALARGLSPIAGKLASLEEGLKVLAEDAHIISGMECTVVVDSRVPPITSEAAVQFYWIAREALSNAVRHSRASLIVIELVADDREIELTVSDNGTGTADGLDSQGGIGMNIMQYRAAILGARLSIESRSSGGLVVRVTAPRHRVELAS